MMKSGSQTTSGGTPGNTLYLHATADETIS